MNKKANVWILAIVGVLALVAVVVLLQSSVIPTGDFQFNLFKQKSVQAPDKYSDAILRSSRKLFIPNLFRSPPPAQQQPARECHNFYTLFTFDPPSRTGGYRVMTGDNFCQQRGGRYSKCSGDVIHEYMVFGYPSTDVRLYEESATITCCTR